MVIWNRGSAILRAPEGDGASGGTGDGAGAGDGAQPKYVTEEALSKAVQGAVRDYLKRELPKTLGPLLAPAVSEAIKPFQETIAAIKTAMEEAESEGSEGANTAEIENHPKFKGLERQLAELRAQAEQAKAEALAEKAKQRDGSLRQVVSEALLKNGIDPKRAKQALGHLVDAEKRILYTEDGSSIVFRDEDGTDVDLATGLKTWAKSDEASIYLPSRGLSGTGERPGGRPATGSPAKLEAGKLGRALMQAVGEMPVTE